MQFGTYKAGSEIQSCFVKGVKEIVQQTSDAEPLFWFMSINGHKDNISSTIFYEHLADDNMKCILKYTYRCFIGIIHLLSTWEIKQRSI